MNRKVLKGLGIAVFVLALMACSRRPEQTADNSAPLFKFQKTKQKQESLLRPNQQRPRRRQQVIQHVMRII